MRWILLPVLLWVGLLPALLAQGPAAKDEDEPAPGQKFPNRWPPAPAPAPEPLPWKLGNRLYTPADASRAAALDAAALAQTIVAEEMAHVRYLSIHNIPAEHRELEHSSVSFLVNSLSRRRDMVIPPRVGPDGIVIRVNLADYDIPPDAWDRMGDTDPYFHQAFQRVEKRIRVIERVRDYEVVEPWPGGVWSEDGKFYPPNSFKYKFWKKERTVQQVAQEDGKVTYERTAGASWLDPAAVTTLLKTIYALPLDHNRKAKQVAPLLRADWFVANASQPPHYHELLQLKTLDDFLELCVYDKRVERLTQAKATVVFSGSDGLARRVARNNRILERVQTAFGAIWSTYDYAESIGEKNVINNFLTEKRDGGEIIGTLPNGLQVYFLVDNKNARVDEVPINIAVDSLAQDARVRNGRSCIWCHSQGIQPFRSDFQAEITPDGLNDLGIQLKHPKDAVQLARKIRDVFGTPSFQAIVKVDNVRYGNAVRAATVLGPGHPGKTAAANAALFLKLYDDYQEVPMDAVRLVYESGLPIEEVQAAIRVRVNGTNNGVLLRQLLKPPLAIRRDHWEEAYADFMLRVMAWQAAKQGIQQQLQPQGMKIKIAEVK